MKIKLTKVLALLVVLLSIKSVQAQVTNSSTYDLQFANPVVDNGSFCVDVQIKGADGAADFVIGSHTIWFLFNENSINNPVYTGQEFQGSVFNGNPTPFTATACPIAPGVNLPPYSNTNYSSAGGEANFTTTLSSFVPGFECPIISSDWVTMANVCFEIVDETQTTELSFSTSFTAINNGTDNPSDQNVANVLGTYDELPVNGSGGGGDDVSAGTPSVSSNLVCFGDDVTFATTGYSVSANNGYIGLGISTNSSETDPGTAQFISPSPYEGETITYTNDGSLPDNTELYLYAFVGEGVPFSFNPTATDIQGTTAFVLLEDIVVNDGEAVSYTCGSTEGTGDVEISVDGGLPSYDNNETFTVAVTGATYTGPATVSNEGT
ncbi:MAG: hypothetical protein ACPGXL_04905, partial [Chitinophagales bacterium]